MLTRVSVAAMNLLLEDVAPQLLPDTHAAMLIDNAGWHTANHLGAPPNITLVHLPPLPARAERHREGLAVSTGSLPVGAPVRRRAGHRRRLLRRMELLKHIKVDAAQCNQAA